MIKLFSLKQQQAKDKQSGNTKKTSAAQIRLQTDMEALDIPKSIKLDIPNPDDLQHFTMQITPDEGYYAGYTFTFNFTFKPSYPHDPPKVLCMQKIYHPNLDLDGNVCLNILREDWKPVLNLQSIIMGLQFLFLEPNSDDPLNKDAAKVMRQNKNSFERNVKQALRGGVVDGVQFDPIPRKF